MTLSCGPLPLVLLLGLLGGAVTAAAAPHAGDVQPHGRNGSIGLNDSLFAADFGDFTGGPFRTTNPGFDVDVNLGPLEPGRWLRYELLGALKFWDGATWTAPVAGETFRLDDAFSSVANPADDSVIDGNGVVMKPTGVIGEVDAAGGLHEHLTMGLRTGGGALGGTAGAYFVSLRLFETAADDNTRLRQSVPYAYVFNRGLTSTNFDLAVAAAPAPVPLPGSLVFAGSCLITLAARRRLNLRAASMSRE